MENKQTEKLFKIINHEMGEEIIRIDNKYNNLSNERKENLLNLLIEWSLDELKKLDKQQNNGN